uniref:Reverse transcriptase domain-containing protein n=1 Tax=Micrurus corallinus TaxID=54390 RepID=A0A2D4EPX2_MICCO
MSSLLFILTIEELTKIRQNKDITGLKMKKQEYKTQAFADDLVFFIEEPMETGTNLLKEIEQYELVAGLKINKEKTKMLVKNLTGKQKNELENWDCKWKKRLMFDNKRR